MDTCLYCQWPNIKGCLWDQLMLIHLMAFPAIDINPIFFTAVAWYTPMVARYRVSHSVGSHGLWASQKYKTNYTKLSRCPGVCGVQNNTVMNVFTAKGHANEEVKSSSEVLHLPVTDEFPSQRPVTRSFDVFCDLRLNKWLSKHSWGWWFETLSRP